MAEGTHGFHLFRHAPDEREEEGAALLAGVTETQRLLGQAYSCFNGTHDPDLIESYVFEINALQSRYSYLLRRVRALDANAAVPAGQEQKRGAIL